MILTDLRHKIKSSLALLDRRDSFMALIIVFTAITAYMLGLLSAQDDVRLPVTIRSAAATIEASGTAAMPVKTTQASPSAAAQGGYVASKSGTKYHLPTCSGASRITEANKIWFKTRAEAEAAGYGPAANCPGL